MVYKGNFGGAMATFTEEGEDFHVEPFLWVRTNAQMVENRFKEVASGILDEIKGVCPDERLDYVIEAVKFQMPQALLKHHLPDEAQMRKVISKNKEHGPNSPCEAFDLVRYQQDGWYGKRLKGDSNMIEHLRSPATEDDMMRNWVLTKVFIENTRHQSRI